MILCNVIKWDIKYIPLYKYKEREDVEQQKRPFCWYFSKSSDMLYFYCFLQRGILSNIKFHMNWLSYLEIRYSRICIKSRHDENNDLALYASWVVKPQYSATFALCNTKRSELILRNDIFLALDTHVNAEFLHI